MKPGSLGPSAGCFPAQLPVKAQSHRAVVGEFAEKSFLNLFLGLLQRCCQLHETHSPSGKWPLKNRRLKSLTSARGPPQDQGVGASQLGLDPRRITQAHIWK